SGLRQCQQMLYSIRGESNLNSTDSLRLQFTKKGVRIVWLTENEEPAGGLWVKHDVLEFRWNSVRNQNIWSEEFSIVGEPTGAKTGAAIFERARQKRKLAVVYLDRNMTCLIDFHTVARKTEAG